MDQELKQIIEFANNNTFARSLDIKVTGIVQGTGQSTIKIIVNPNHLNPMGTLHGGIISSLADISMGVAVRALGKTGVTINLNTNFLAPGYLGETIIATGKVVHNGNTLVSTECTVKRDDDVLATATGLFFVVK